MIDKLKLNTEYSTIGITKDYKTFTFKISYAATKGLYELEWRKYLYLEFNPNKLYNRLILRQLGNFYLINYADFIRIWKWLKNDIEEKLTAKVIKNPNIPDKQRAIEEIEGVIDVLDIAGIREMHVCRNIECNHPAYIYINDVFANLRAKGRYVTKIIPEETTVRFETKNVGNLVVYDKNIEFEYHNEIPLEEKGYYLRIEVQTITPAYVANTWQVENVRDLFDKNNFYRIQKLYPIRVNERLFESEFIPDTENRKIITPTKAMKKFIADNPVFEHIDYVRFFEKFPDKKSYRKYLAKNLLHTPSKINTKLEEYEKLWKYFESRDIRAKTLLVEIIKKINEN